MIKLGVKHRHSTPYYPQCNGLVEKVNGMICKIISKQVGSKTQHWDKHLNAALWAYRTSFRTSLGFTPFHLVHGQEALLPIEVELSSLRVLLHSQKKGKGAIKERLLDLERLALNREEATQYYAKHAEVRKEKFNQKLAPKSIKKGSLVLRYNDRFDYNKSDKFVPHWEGPFKVVELFDNGSYQLMDASGELHKTRVNGWRLKPYFSQVIEDQAGAEQVILTSKEPLGVSAQDPSLAQHVPCTDIINIGPITRPCIDTILCNPGTTSDHLVTSREDECTSRLQREAVYIAKGLEQEA